MNNAKWGNWINLALGIWLFITPWIITNNLPADVAVRTDWNAWSVGVIMALMAGFALQDIKPWEEWVNLVLGVWMILSPWIFGFVKETGLLWNSVLVGALAAVLSGISIPVAQKLQHQK